MAAVGAGDKQQLRLGRALLANFWAGLRYQNDHPHRAEQPYDGRAVLFIPEGDFEEKRRLTVEQWVQEFGREPEVASIPGKHKTLIYEEGAEATGVWLSEEVARWANP